MASICYSSARQFITMGAAYTILGRQVPSHVLSILTLGSVAGFALYPRGSGTPAEAPAAAVAAPVSSPVAAAKDGEFDLEKWFNDLSKEESK